jgi:hypothetical protein
MDKKTLFSTVATVLLLVAAFVFCPRAESIMGMEGQSGSSGYRLVQDSFDRESCERDCRERYGTELFRRGRGGHMGNYYVYAQCIQDCETRFWKEYDRNMGELEKEKP